MQALAREEKNYKVRDVKYNRQLGRLASLTTNGCVQLWDPHLTLDRIVSQFTILEIPLLTCPILMCSVRMMPAAVKTPCMLFTCPSLSTNTLQHH